MKFDHLPYYSSLIETIYAKDGVKVTFDHNEKKYIQKSVMNFDNNRNWNWKGTLLNNNFARANFLDVLKQNEIDCVSSDSTLANQTLKITGKTIQNNKYSKAFSQEVVLNGQNKVFLNQPLAVVDSLENLSSTNLSRTFVFKDSNLQSGIPQQGVYLQNKIDDERVINYQESGVLTVPDGFYFCLNNFEVGFNFHFAGMWVKADIQTKDFNDEDFTTQAIASNGNTSINTVLESHVFARPNSSFQIRAVVNATELLSSNYSGMYAKVLN